MTYLNLERCLGPNDLVSIGELRYPNRAEATRRFVTLAQVARRDGRDIRTGDLVIDVYDGVDSVTDPLTIPAVRVKHVLLHRLASAKAWTAYQSAAPRPPL